METRRLLDRELDLLRDRLLRLGGETETALDRATHALTARDSSMAREVIVNDDEIDQLELQIDQHCIDIIALRQPTANDLRLVMSSAKMAPLLERIGDHICSIARTAVTLNEESPLTTLLDIPRMADIAGEMLREALVAYAGGDAIAARKVIERDEELDKLYDHVSGKLVEMMVNASTTTARATHLLFVAKHLERIGDYVTHIAEMIIYMMEAAVVKRRSTRRLIHAAM
jgi:phosphate transport system protein